jgi:hypothetical protein
MATRRPTLPALRVWIRARGERMKSLQIGGEDLGVIHAKKSIGDSRIWLTAKADATWWVVVIGPDQKLRTVGFVRPPQDERARETYDALISKPDVRAAFLEGRAS